MHRGIDAGKSNGGKGKPRRKRAVSTAEVPIDAKEVRGLLWTLAPNATEKQVGIAERVLIRAIEDYRNRAFHTREGHPLKPTEGFKEFRRGLNRYRKKTPIQAVKNDPFSDFPGGVIKDLCKKAYLLKLIDFRHLLDTPGAADQFIKEAVLNDVVGIDNAELKGVAGNLLDSALEQQDAEEDLAGYVFLAISIGLEMRPAMTLVGDLPMKKGANYARLLTLALTQAGAELPGSLRPLMLRGKQQAQHLLSNQIEMGVGPSYSYLDVLMSGLGEIKKFLP